MEHAGVRSTSCAAIDDERRSREARRVKIAIERF